MSTETKYDVFISYRRKGGSEKAELLKTVFMQRGYRSSRIFMDTHSLPSGDYYKKLAEAINKSDNVVVLITKGCFENLSENDCWFFEIKTALDHKKNIIPVFFDGLKATDFPDSLQALSVYNGLSYNHEYADAFYEKLLSFLIKKNEQIRVSYKQLIKKNYKYILLILLVLFIGLISRCDNNYYKSSGSDNITKSIDSLKTNSENDVDDVQQKNDELLNLLTNLENEAVKEKDSSIILTSGDFIDLGISVNWASCNIGASSPKEAGYYFAWGELTEKDEYTIETYAYKCKSYGFTEAKKIGNEISRTKYDAAKYIMADKCRMPTKQEMKELILNCDWEYQKINNIEGMLVTGKNGNCIFIPEVGHKEGLSSSGVSYYWTGTANEYGTPYSLYISVSPYTQKVDLIDHVSVEYGLPIRAVSDSK